MRINLGIRGKLVATLILAGLLPLLLSLAILLMVVFRVRLVNVGQSFQSVARQDADNLATQLAAQIELAHVFSELPAAYDLVQQANQIPPPTTSQINTIESAWQSLDANRPPLVEILHNPVAEQWRTIREQRLRFAEIMVTDAAGRLIASTNRTSDYFQADEAWWQACRSASANQVLLEDVQWDASAIARDGSRGLYVLNLLIPLHDAASGRFSGAMKVSLDVQWLVTQLNAFRRPAGTDARVWLARGNGMPVLPVTGAGTTKPVSDADINSPPPALSLEVVQRMAGQRGGFVINRNPDDAVIGFAQMTLPETHVGIRHNLDWTVVIAASRHNALAPLYRLTWLILGLGLLTIALCFVIGLYIARREVIRPLLALRHGVGELSRGNINFRLPLNDPKQRVFRNDEIGQLAGDFNRMADELRATMNRLEQASLIKQQFIDLASHELRTPVTYILGVAELAEKQGIESGGPPRPLASKIINKARRLARIIDNMMKLLRDGSFDTALHLTPVDIPTLIESAVQELQPFLTERKQTLKVDVAPDVPPMLADVEKLKDVMLNLVGNAIRFSPDGSTVRIEARAAGSAVEIDVIDSGGGIPPEELPQVFEPFQPQAPGGIMRHTSGDYAFGTRGMGLGLSVVKRFVDLHGGTVSVESSPAGTRMRVHLPVNISAAALEGAASAAGTAGDGEAI